MKRLLDVSDGLHAHRKLYRQKLPQVSLPNANGFPALTPLRVTKSFVNFSGLSFDVMVVVAIYIHPHREKDHEIDEDGRKPPQGLKFDSEVKGSTKQRLRTLLLDDPLGMAS